MAATVPHVPWHFGGYLPFKGEVAKTADYTVKAHEAGTLFTNAGATGNVVFTLPAIAPNLLFAFRCVADYNLTVASAEGDNIVAFNDDSADSVAFSTSGQKIGGGVILHSNLAGTKWYVRNISAGANTITVAT